MTGPEITFTVEITAHTIDTNDGSPLYLYRAEATARRAVGAPEIAAYQYRSGWTPGIAAEQALQAVEVELAKQAEQARWLAEEERQQAEAEARADEYASHDEPPYGSFPEER